MKYPLHWEPESKVFALLVVTGLVVSWVRQFLAHHWKSFASWEDFFISWLVHTVAVGLLAVFAGAVILRTQNFFVGSEHEENYTKKQRFMSS